MSIETILAAFRADNPDLSFEVVPPPGSCPGAVQVHVEWPNVGCLSSGGGPAGTWSVKGRVLADPGDSAGFVAGRFRAGVAQVRKRVVEEHLRRHGKTPEGVAAERPRSAP